MMIQSNQAPQGRPRQLGNLSRNQLLVVDSGSRMQDLLESTSGLSVCKIQSELRERALQGKTLAFQGACMATAGALFQLPIGSSLGVNTTVASFLGTAAPGIGAVVGIAGLGLLVAGLVQSSKANRDEQFV